MQYRHCAESGCEEKFFGNRGAMMKAHYSGWYLQKSGKVWCPDHRPAWAPKFEKRSDVLGSSAED